MSQNPLLGKRISLISKKNIRYEGILYSINEQNATVALQNVRSFGTEGRSETVVEATDDIHPYLLFRGQDIQDLHVHEEEKEETASKTPASTSATSKTDKDTAANSAAAKSTITTAPIPTESKKENQNIVPPPPPQQQKVSTGPIPTDNDPSENSDAPKRRPRRNNNNNNKAIGTGASLLNRKARGAVEQHQQPASDFDFETSNDQFSKIAPVSDTSAKESPKPIAYEKNDFFDSISCDAIDKQSGVDNRVRGRAERQLNTETFGAVALNRRRGGRGGRGGRGRGGRGGRGGRRNYNKRNDRQHDKVTTTA